MKQKLYKVEVKSCYGDLTRPYSTARILVGDSIMIYNLSKYKNGDGLLKKSSFLYFEIQYLEKKHFGTVYIVYFLLVYFIN